jgi:hypothetical protein
MAALVTGTKLPNAENAHQFQLELYAFDPTLATKNAGRGVA